jgi:5-methyltetrahydropteroyltriglutamate--homocysteine methyltransferase
MGIKLKDVVNLPIPTTQVGTYPRPSWYNYNIRDRAWEQICDEEPHFLESYNDAVRTIMLDHEEGGLDILTDGCIRYSRPLGTVADWDTNNVAYIGGLELVRAKPQGATLASAFLFDNPEWAYSGITGHPVGETNYRSWWVAVDEPSVGKLDLWVETAKIALQNAKGKPFKFSGPSIAVAAERIFNKSGKSDRDIYFSLLKAENEVLRQIANLGCKIIQIDYPFGGAHWLAQFKKMESSDWKELVDAFNEEIKGVNAHVWVHFCFGAPILYGHETPHMKWHMSKVYPYIADCKADCLQSEAANTDGKYLEEELQAWKEYCSDKDYAVGAVTPYDLTETAEDVDSIVEKALKYVPPDKLALASDEGIGGHGILDRRGASTKMRLLSEAAKRARKRVS